MNTSTKHFLPRIISAVIAVLLALTVAVPAMGAAASEGDNLTITIKNNVGLPKMEAGMFAVYQLFKGTPEINGDKRPNPWEAENWNNYVLADIEWGASVKEPDTFIEKLQALDDEWAKDTSGKLFDTVDTAAQLANVLVGKNNEFMQHFAKWLVESKQLTALSGEQISETVVSGTTSAEDKIIYQVKDAGYYLLAEQNKLGAVDTAESEYIIAVLGNQTLNLKASIPVVDKEIKTTTRNVKGTSADINEKLTFVIEGTLPKNYDDFVNGYEYIFHDSLPGSYSTIEDVVVTISTDVNGDGVISDDEIFTLTADQYYIGTRSNSLSTIDCTQEFLIGKQTEGDRIYSDITSLEGEKDDEGNTIQINKSSKITVQYTTSLDRDAKLGNGGTTGNKSSVILQYSNDPNAELTSASRTAYSEVYVYTYGLDLKKVESARKAGLAGAGFLLYKTDSDGKIISYATFDTITNSDPANRKVVGYRFKGWTNDISAVDELIENYDIAKEAYDNASNADRADSESDENKALNEALGALKDYLLYSSNAEGEVGVIPDITGIAADTYALTEVITPAGYNTMADFNLKIAEELTEATGILESFTYTSDTNKTGTVYSASSSGTDLTVFNNGLIPQQLENIKAPLLPFTGGIGTVIFYVLGGALIAGAIVYIVIIAKKRSKETENSDK